MMDPEIFKLAQEQMSRIPPSEFARLQQQMINNPELMRLATTGMKDLKPDDIRFAAEQMKQLRPEDMAEMSARLAQVSPEEIAAMRVQADAQQAYEYQGSLMLKNQGNQLHGIGKYDEAIEKYSRAKKNLLSLCTSEAAALRQACSLNLMSCYLKTGEFDKTIAEGIEILASDENNLKALYRRGQAYRELGKLSLAVADLRKAAKLSPDDETVNKALRKLQDQLEMDGEVVDEEIVQLPTVQNGPIIEEISESEVEILSVATSSKEVDQNPPDSTEYVLPNTAAFSQTFDSLKQNPEMVSCMQSMMRNLEPEQIAAMSGGKLTPEMAKMAMDMVKQMSDTDMQNMLGMMSSLENESTAKTTATTSQSMPTTSGSSSTSRSTSLTGRSPSTSSFTRSDIQNLTSVFPASTPDLSSISPEMQEQMRQQMKDPMMTQMMSSMMQNMSPESMVAMGEKMGFKLSREDAEKAKAAMANLSPQDVERMMKWADRAQKVVDVVKKGKNFVLGRSGLILAIVILILAVVLHWLGVIGS